MVRKAAEMEKEVRERMREGQGSVEVLHVFKKEELKGKARLFAKLKLDRGCSIGHHAHENEEEVFYIIQGSGVVSEDGTQTPVQSGDAILTGGGSGHSIRNDGEDPLILMAVILLYD